MITSISSKNIISTTERNVFNENSRILSSTVVVSPIRSSIRLILSSRRIISFSTYDRTMGRTIPHLPRFFEFRSA